MPGVDRTVELDYDADGTRTEWREDTDGDGVFDRVWPYEYDLTGLTVMALADEDGDGTTDVWWHYVRDDMDRIVAVEGDHGDDGTIDERYGYVYDDTVTEGVAYEYTYDAENDGYPDEVRFYVYDADDLLLEYEYHVPADDTHATYAYTYNSDGDRIAYTSEYIWEGTLNDVQTGTYTYASPGRISTFHVNIDFTGDGVSDMSIDDETTWSCP